MKDTKFETLLTPYAERMDKVTPWSDYPRPRMRRDSYMSLNGEWDFTIADKDFPKVYDNKILVPFPPESVLSGLEVSVPRDKFLHYKRSFSLPVGFNRGRVILHFGAVDEMCSVRVNGVKVITHKGGYLPFSADITDALVEGENVILVRAKDELSGKYPYGKQKESRGGMWYTPVSGIWQSVWLESVPPLHIEKIKVTTDRRHAKIEVLGGEDKKTLTLFDGTSYEFVGGSVDIYPKNPIEWSPENPYLYKFTLECGLDRVVSYFALRDIECRSINGIPRLCLNGKPYLFNGLLDQGYYPDGLFLPATVDGYIDDILLTKTMGFNMLRKHIKVEPEIFYYLCDKMGIAVFQDMVNNSGYSFLLDTALPTIGFKRVPDRLRHKNRETREIFKRHCLDIVEHLYSHPSVLYYTVFNEGWGQFCADKMYDFIKAADPGKIVDATSGWFTRKKSDVDSRHVYFKAVKLGTVGTRPIVISEFGGYSHRVDGHLFGSKNYGYKLFSDEGDFERAFIKLYSEEISPLIPRGISALVYTQLSDIEDETNGIITYDRRHVKLSAEKIWAVMKRLSNSINNEKGDITQK